jgi:hypothetical protein
MIFFIIPQLERVISFKISDEFAMDLVPKD